MFYIDKNQNMVLQRGDIMQFNIYFKDVNTHQNYEFVKGDKITFTISKNYRKCIYQKEVIVSEPTDKITIIVLDTDFGNRKNAPEDFWYDVVLNSNQTVIGYDLGGPKLITLLPRNYEGECK